MPAGASVFIDTNVLLYSVDPSHHEKRRLVWLWLDILWEDGLGRLSWQVLHEFYANALRKLRLERSEARAIVQGYTEWHPVDTTFALIERAWHWMDHAQLPYWDALIVAAAEHAGCDILLTEDFQAGRSFGFLTVVNPFVERPGRLR